MSDKLRTESELWDAIEAIAHGQAAMVAAEYGLGEQRESYVTNPALRNLLKGLVREAHERSAGAAPLDVERLAQAIHKSFGGDIECDHTPVRICYEYAVEQAAEYVRLSEGTDR